MQRIDLNCLSVAHTAENSVLSVVFYYSRPSILLVNIMILFSDFSILRDVNFPRYAYSLLLSEKRYSSVAGTNC